MGSWRQQNWADVLDSITPSQPPQPQEQILVHVTGADGNPAVLMDLSNNRVNDHNGRLAFQSNPSA